MKKRRHIIVIKDVIVADMLGYWLIDTCCNIVMVILAIGELRPTASAKGRPPMLGESSRPRMNSAVVMMDCVVIILLCEIILKSLRSV